MKRLVLFSLVIGAAFGANAVAGGRAASADVLACGADLQPGVYTLTKDLHCTGNGLAVEGQATINLNGHSIFGPGPATDTVGLDFGGQGARLQNGNVRGFGTGVLAEADARISQVRVSNNGVGFSGTPDTRLTLQQSFVNENLGDGYDNGSPDAGIFLTDSQVSGNGGDGIRTHENIIVAVRSQFSRNGGYGIWEDEWGVDIEDSQASNNGADGIYMGSNDFPDTYTLLNNKLIHNGGHGMVFDAFAGPFVSHPVISQGNIARENQTNPQCVDISCNNH